MATFVERAQAHGGVIRTDAVCVPASTVVAFLEAEASAGCTVLGIDCLYFHEAGGTEPSMELSCTYDEFGSMPALIAFARSAAAMALARATEKNARAFFEVSE